MKEVKFPVVPTRRQLLAGSLALAGGAMSGQSKKYAPRIVCNMYYYVQLFSTPFRFISSRPDPLKASPPADQSAGRTGRQGAGQVPTGGTVWTREQWYTALSDVQDAGYRRLEMMSGTVLAKPIGEIQALLEQYGLFIDHVWHSGRLYPAEAADSTIAKAIELLDYIKPLKSPDFYFDPFGDRGPLSDEEAKSQNRGLDRIGREVKDRGMKLCIHNHESPMRYGANEWLGVLHLSTHCVPPKPLLYQAGDKGRLGAIHMRTQHLKIADQTMEDGGDIDFHKAAAYLKKIQFDGGLVEETEWMKETKVTRSARENKRLARIWCEKVYGVSAKT